MLIMYKSGQCPIIIVTSSGESTLSNSTVASSDNNCKATSTYAVAAKSPDSWSRKRRPSNSNEDLKEDQMNECTAALVLMSLSCSPNSSINGGGTGSWVDQQPVSPSASFSDCCSWRSGTPSPPLSESGASGVWGSVGTDEGIVMDEDYEDHQPRKRKVVSSSMSRILFQCTWPGCMVITTTCDSIENHVRTVHLGPRRAKLVGADGVEEEIDDHEEEFYYTEVELGETYSPPTLSHRDMARPPHEDPEYQKSLGTLPSLIARPINIPKYVKNSVPWSFSANHNTTNTPVKQLKLSLSAPPTTIAKRARGEIKKCRKVYGMEHRDLWCTQCKWKKACSRFSD